MKNFLIASALSVAAVLSVAPQSQAANVTVVTSERTMTRHHDGYGYRHDRPRHKCMVKKVRSYHHGRVVVRETRVCR